MADNKSERIIPPYTSKDIASFLGYCRAFPQFRFGDCGLRQGEIAKELQSIFADNLFIIPFELMVKPLCDISFQCGEHVDKLDTGNIINASHSWDKVLAAREALQKSKNIKKARKNFYSLINSDQKLTSSNIHVEILSNWFSFAAMMINYLETLISFKAYAATT